MKEHEDIIGLPAQLRDLVADSLCVRHDVGDWLIAATNAADRIDGLENRVGAQLERIKDLRAIIEHAISCFVADDGAVVQPSITDIRILVSQLRGAIAQLEMRSIEREEAADAG